MFVAMEGKVLTLDKFSAVAVGAKGPRLPSLVY